ncbi:MAG: hypothetical protein J6J17_00550 [Bacilli bacterium]|nr:hypothetical protein [Bacilli bacterium]
MCIENFHFGSLEYELYDNDFIDSLRDKTCNGIPLHILALSYYLCRKNCHFVTVQLTTGMDKFNLVRGNVSSWAYDIDGNHSWIEKDGFVYDTTKGVKFKKEYYYEIFNPQIIRALNEDNYIDDNIYMYFLISGMQDVENERRNLELTFKMLEYLEKLKPTINGKRLLNEIEKYRIENPYNEKLPEEIVKKYINDMAPSCLEGVMLY